MSAERVAVRPPEHAMTCGHVDAVAKLPWAAGSDVEGDRLADQALDLFDAVPCYTCQRAGV